MRVLVSALERSANVHLASLLKHLNDIELVGIFDTKLGNPIVDLQDSAIMGVVDAVKQISYYKSLANQMCDLADDADKVLLIDSSGFNLPLAQKIKQAHPNKEIIYYILPQVWASRPNRHKKLEKYCDKLLGILPFEPNYYTQKATYIGHPLLDQLPKKSGYDKDGYIVFMPGSRASEIKRLFPIFQQLRAMFPKQNAALVIPPNYNDTQIQELYGDVSMFYIKRDTIKALKGARFAFICSGTATLEAALMGIPFTLAYIARGLDYFIGKKIFKIKQIGLANIILDKLGEEPLHNELMQESVTAENLLAEYHDTKPKEFRKKAKKLRKYLGHGSSEGVAAAILDRDI